MHDAEFELQYIAPAFHRAGGVVSVWKNFVTDLLSVNIRVGSVVFLWI